MFLTDGPDAAEQVYVFAHGAGGAMDTPFMSTVARELGERGIRVVRFEFPYMAARRTGGKRGAPDREPVLLNTWREVAAQLGGGPRLFIGGKSMGGRMATLVADELQVRGAVVFGYPFHPPGTAATNSAPRISRTLDHADARAAGRARSVRHARRRRRLPPLAADPHRMDSRRRSLAQAAREIGNDRAPEPPPRHRRRRGIHERSMKDARAKALVVEDDATTRTLLADCSKASTATSISPPMAKKRSCNSARATTTSSCSTSSCRR